MYLLMNNTFEINSNSNLIKITKSRQLSSFFFYLWYVFIEIIELIHLSAQYLTLS